VTVEILKPGKQGWPQDDKFLVIERRLKWLRFARFGSYRVQAQL